MGKHDDDVRIKLGRIRDRGGARRKPDTFISEVMRAAKKAGHVGNSFGRAFGDSNRSRFGRWRGAALSLSRSSRSRRVMTKPHIVRHTRSGFRSTPVSRHVADVKRGGVTHDGGVDGQTHHVRFAYVEFTSDAALGAIVEVRTYEDAAAARDRRHRPAGCSVICSVSPRRSTPSSSSRSKS